MKILSTKRIAAYSEDSEFPILELMEVFKACAKLSNYKVLRKEDYSLGNYPSFIGYSDLSMQPLHAKALSLFKSLGLKPKVLREKDRIFVVGKFISAQDEDSTYAWIQLIPHDPSYDEGTIIEFISTYDGSGYED